MARIEAILHVQEKKWSSLPAACRCSWFGLEAAAENEVWLDAASKYRASTPADVYWHSFAEVVMVVYAS